MPDERLTPKEHAPEAAIPGAGARGAAPPLEDAELVQLQIRVIALENLLIALLAQASEQQLDLARHMAAHISPRAGATPHRLTLHAAAEMLSLIKRAAPFRSAQQAAPPAGATTGSASSRAG